MESLINDWKAHVHYHMHNIEDVGALFENGLCIMHERFDSLEFGIVIQRRIGPALHG